MCGRLKQTSYQYITGFIDKRSVSVRMLAACASSFKFYPSAVKVRRMVEQQPTWVNDLEEFVMRGQLRPPADRTIDCACFGQRQGSQSSRSRCKREWWSAMFPGISKFLSRGLLPPLFTRPLMALLGASDMAHPSRRAVGQPWSHDNAPIPHVSKEMDESALCCGALHQTLRLSRVQMQWYGVPRQRSGPTLRDRAVNSVASVCQSRPCAQNRACLICQGSSPRIWIERAIRCKAMGQSHEMTVRWSVRVCVMLAVPYAYPRSSSASFDRDRDGPYTEADKQLIE
ncbi:hypothetical protein FB567DRAFT_543363 [Paraphoma chrysanthemicola]|uniref:Uncharacterized protein n=1 Tax=Paraphoma chrysanthemicola TaxID=798071 RepID=A0A8K0RKE5_9PLEO|nr:hypothetical protein FB567DRAFT_543363 [Paraphoma chrysanthemicola]